MALLYGYLFPVLFLVIFWALYRHETVPLLLHFGELLTVTVLGGACFGLPTTMVSERERGVWRRYRLAPISIGRLLVSTVLARFLIVLTAGILQLGLALAVGMTAPAHPGALALSFVTVSFAFIGLGLVIAALADTVPAVQALGQCVFLPLLVLGGVAIPIASLPNWAQQLSTFLPGRYAVDALQRSMTEVSAGGAEFAWLALVLIGVAASLTGAKLLRWEPGQYFRSLPDKAWLAPAFAAWLLVGFLAQRHFEAPPANPSLPSVPAASLPAAAQVTLQPWERLTAGDLNAIAYVVPADDGLVTPIARPEEKPDDETDLMLAKLEGELPHWAPGRVADPVQRIRNLICVAGVLDVLQNPVERYVPLLVEQRLQADFPRDKLILLLGWIALHPEEGSVVADLSEMHLRGAASAAVVRERVKLYAIKFLARLTGRTTTRK